MFDFLNSVGKENTILDVYTNPLVMGEDVSNQITIKTTLGTNSNIQGSSLWALNPNTPYWDNYPNSDFKYTVGSSGAGTENTVLLDFGRRIILRNLYINWGHLSAITVTYTWEYTNDGVTWIPLTSDIGTTAIKGIEFNSGEIKVKSVRCRFSFNNNAEYFNLYNVTAKLSNLQ